MKKIILVAFAILTTLTVEARSIMPSQYEVLTATLDKKHFDFSNQIVLFNKAGNEVYLRIMNDICPFVPGRPTCRAAPMIVLDAKFTLSNKVKTGSCNSKIQKSDVVLVDGKKAQIIFTDHTQNICDLVYVSDYNVSLKIKDEAGVKSLSVLNVSNRPRN